MNHGDSFYESVKSLSRNPLGIIALFLMLSYLTSALVISFAGDNFYKHPKHPSVYFLVLFPPMVLITFYLLVTKYHRNLYAPQDFKNTSEFFFGLKVPSGLEDRTTGAVTSDTSLQSIPLESMPTIEAKYKQIIDNGFTLLHQSMVLQQRTSPKSGRYRVRVWIEAIDRVKPLGDIESVTYHIWHDFPKTVLSTADEKSCFDLWLTVYGEFPVLALIKLRSGELVEVQRFIDLPGRPPD